MAQVKVRGLSSTSPRSGYPSIRRLALLADASDGEKVLAMARDTLEHFKYEGQLEAALAGCI